MLSKAGILPASKKKKKTYPCIYRNEEKPILAWNISHLITLGMSDDEVDTDLLELLRKSLAVDGNSPSAPAKTGVLEDAEFIYDNSTDVALDMRGTKAAASSIWTSIQRTQYSTKDWSQHELHPKTKDESTVDFVFLMDLLNFCFWSEGAPSEQYAVEYRGKTWTGYWSLVAAIHRALDEGTIRLNPFQSAGGLPEARRQGSQSQVQLSG